MTFALSAKAKLLWVGLSPVPPAMRQALGHGWELLECTDLQSLAERLQMAAVAVIYPDGQGQDPRWLGEVLRALERSPAVGVFMLDPTANSVWTALGGRSGQFLCIRQDAPGGELAAKVEAAAALQPAIRSLRSELRQARKLADESSEALDEEMRLAARLQRDFLPRRLPEVDPARFGVLYRPATWVSGDIYDATRLDETHVGFYVADVVGHGMPAALLTMFIKKALQTKRIVGNTYEIVPPHISLAELNADICQQNLSSCHFCTAVYCVLDVASLKLSYSRAGHPEPILVRADGSVERPGGPGSLLGVFEQEQFVSNQLQLAPGDRLVLYTDGADDALRRPEHENKPLERILQPWLRMPREDLLLKLAAVIDAQAGCFRPQDDVTMLVLDIMPA